MERHFLPGKGYFFFDRSDDKCPDFVVFPKVICLEIQDDFIIVFPVCRAGNDINDNKGCMLREECNLEDFDNALKSDTYPQDPTPQDAEDLIYSFEAHGVKLHPAIYRKYKPNNQKQS